MFDRDYNSNGNLNKTLKTIESLSGENKSFSREDLYKYSDDEDTVYTYLIEANKWGIGKNIVDPQTEIKNKEIEYGERLSRHCQIEAYAFEETSCILRVRQTPGFLLTEIADMVVNNHPNVKEYTYFGNNVGFYVAKKYEEAKKQFCHSGADNKITESEAVRKVRWGGMVNPHMPATYYFIANDYHYKF